MAIEDLNAELAAARAAYRAASAGYLAHPRTVELPEVMRLSEVYDAAMKRKVEHLNTMLDKLGVEHV